MSSIAGFDMGNYCGKTTGELLVEDPSVLDRIYSAWESAKPILLHGEGDMVELCLELGKKYARRVHVCHVSTLSDLRLVKCAKEKQNGVTAGVTPHHLFLTNDDTKKLGPFGLVKPPIGDDETRLGLWEGLKNGVIDLVESDHAPHTKKDKLSGAQMFGVPGLETTLGLFCRAIYQKMTTMDEVIRWFYETPKKVFNIPDQNNTFVELDPSKPFIVGQNGYQTKCGWSPFDGWELFGHVETVVLKKKTLVAGGKLV